MSLGSLKAKVKTKNYRTVEVDITEFCDGDEKQVLVLREPGIDEVFSLPGMLPKYRQRFPELSDETLFSVALYAECHVSPEQEPEEPSPGEFYASLVSESEPLLFLKIADEFASAFPWLSHYLKSLDEKKRNADILPDSV